MKMKDSTDPRDVLIIKNLKKRINDLKKNRDLFYKELKRRMNNWDSFDTISSQGNIDEKIYRHSSCG